jgi:hypothetical protein
LRFFKDGGATFYNDMIIPENKQDNSAVADGADFIFNAGTRISTSAKCETGGKNIRVWLKIQTI